MQTIDCPVNLRKDSVRLERRPNLVLECSLDVEMESVLRVKVMRSGKLVYHRRKNVREIGIGQATVVDMESED